MKEIHKLIGRLTILSRFVPKLVEKSKLIVHCYAKQLNSNGWTNAKKYFFQLKAFLASILIIQKPDNTGPIIVYLAVSEKAVSASLVQEVERRTTSLFCKSGSLEISSYCTKNANVFSKSSHNSQDWVSDYEDISEAEYGRLLTFYDKCTTLSEVIICP